MTDAPKLLDEVVAEATLDAAVRTAPRQDAKNPTARIAESGCWLTSKLRRRGRCGWAVGGLMVTLALAGGLAPGVSATPKPKFSSPESVTGKKPSGCFPSDQTCPSSNPFASSSEWYQLDSRVTQHQVFAQVDAFSPDVVHVGDYAKFEVVRLTGANGSSVDPNLVTLFWGASPTGTLEQTGTGCGPDHPDTFCVFKAKRVTHGWAREWVEYFIGGGDSPSIAILTMLPVAVVAQYMIEVNVESSYVPVKLIALDAKGHPLTTKNLTTDEGGFLEELVTRPGKFIAFLPHGWSGDVGCLNGKRIHYGGRLACKLRLTDKHPYGGTAGARFVSG